MKICQYLCLHMKIICWRYHIKTPSFWDTPTWDMFKVCLQTFQNNRICYKLANMLRNVQTSRTNNSRILRIKNAKISRYCFYMTINIYGHFQVCISIPLMKICSPQSLKLIVCFEFLKYFLTNENVIIHFEVFWYIKDKVIIHLISRW